MSYQFQESVVLKLPEMSTGYASFAESDYRENNKLIIEIAAIHAGLTANFNMYTASALEASLGTWIAPYARPIIMNHDHYSESVGRVMASRMDQESDGTRYVRLQVGITDPVAMEKVLDQRYLTGSVGGSAKSAKCSICDVDWAKANLEDGMPCRHRRGKVYEGKLAYFELGEISFVEYSFVNIPADAHSGVRSVGDSKQEEGEDEWTHSISMYTLDMNKESVADLAHDGVNILESMKRKDAKATYLALKGTFLSVSALECTENDSENSEITEKVNTINNESDVSTDDLSSLQNDEESFKENDMSKEAAEHAIEDIDDDDILNVTEQLSADLAKDADEDVKEVSESEEVAEETEVSAEVEEEVAPEAETEVVEEEVVAEAETPAEEEVVTTEGEEQLDIEAAEESTSEDVEPAEVAEEVIAEASEVEEESSTEEEVNPLAEEVDKLKEQNAKLKKALHSMLAERVVDSKIYLGLEEKDNREALIAEHLVRTASSLADALKDLDRYPAKVENSDGIKEAFESGVKAAGSSNERGTETFVTVTEQKDERTWEKRAEDTLTDVLMGRVKFN